MGSSASCDDSVSASFGVKSCIYGLNFEDSCAQHEQSSYGNTENNVKEISLEDLYSYASEDGDFNDSIVKELGTSVFETLHIHDPPEPSCAMNPTLPQENINICNQLEDNPCSFDTVVLEGLNNCAAIVCSEMLQSYDAGDGFSCMIVPNEKFSEAENPAFVQPLSSTRRLIPALKGSRAQHGIHLNTKLNVKWAPEVYDPPPTSSSHTVKGHHRQLHHQHHRHHHHHFAKAKKDHHNHKYSKGKSTRGSVSERKHSHRRSSGSSLTDARILRLQELECNRPLLNSCGQSKIEFLDLAVGTNEVIKFRSSCYMESLSPVQLPVAEAS